MGNVNQTFCPKLLATNQTLIYFFSFLWHKIIVRLFNMFIYTKVGHSKFIEMHGDASDFYRSTLVIYTWHQVNIRIYQSVYLHTDMCKLNAYAIKKLYSIVAIWFKVWQIIITAFTFLSFWWSVTVSIRLCYIGRDIFLLLKITQIWVIAICVVLDHSTVIFQKERGGYI